ncbi:hypothetical protein Syun_004893 [Stephania yunnanensis]|uniref:RNase H type-1 domain-containing protein n=1 Tax=Stephania yunnanensis TaxID=152371 RepID=A0AAP0Q5E0_9MAGN
MDGECNNLPRNLRLITDAATNTETGESGAGLVLLNEGRKLILAGSSYPGDTPSVSIAEALAIRTTLEHCHPYYKRIKIYSNVETVIKGFHSPQMCDYSIEPIMLDILNLTYDLNQNHFHFVPREEVVLAHNLAKRALMSDLDCIWSDPIPYPFFLLPINVTLRFDHWNTSNGLVN